MRYPKTIQLDGFYSEAGHGAIGFIFREARAQMYESSSQGTKKSLPFVFALSSTRRLCVGEWAALERDIFLANTRIEFTRNAVFFLVRSHLILLCIHYPEF